MVHPIMQDEIRITPGENSTVSMLNIPMTPSKKTMPEPSNADLKSVGSWLAS